VLGITDKGTQTSDTTALDKIAFRLLTVSLFPPVYKVNYSHFIFKVFSLLSWKYRDVFHVPLYPWGQTRQDFYWSGFLGDMPGHPSNRHLASSSLPNQCYIYSAARHDKTQVSDGKSIEKIHLTSVF